MFLDLGSGKGFAWLEMGRGQCAKVQDSTERGGLWAAEGWSVHLVLGRHRHKWGEAAICPFLLIASQCQDGT